MEHTADLQVEGNSFSCADEVAKRISRLYGDDRLADVTFVVRQGEGPERRFFGHRNIISVWSGPLERMLCGSFAEGSQREVFVKDVDPAAFDAMLKLMYCGVVDIDVDNVLAVLDVSVRFDVQPMVQFCVEFLQTNINSEHACRMLETGVQYSMPQIIDKCIDLIVNDHLLDSEDFTRLSQSAVLELAKHDSWNVHEDEIYDTMTRWAAANSASEDARRALLEPILEHVRFPHMSVDKLKTLTGEVPNHLLFDALFFKLNPSPSGCKPRLGSPLFSWVPTQKVTVSGKHKENARHTSTNGFTGVRGDRRMQFGQYSWSIDIGETQSSWIFVGIARADDKNDVAWRSSGRMLYCLDSRFFHEGAGQNHPCGDRKVGSGDTIHIVLDCTRHTCAFGINSEPTVLFRDLPPIAYVAAVDLRDCGDKVRILSRNPHRQTGWTSARAVETSFPDRDRVLDFPSSDLPDSDSVRASPSDVARRVPGEVPHGAHPNMPSGSNARMSQPRQSQGAQGSQGGLPAAAERSWSRSDAGPDHSINAVQL